MRINGLYSLMLNFYDAVEAVMSIHGVDPTEANAAYAAYLAVEDDHSPGLLREYDLQEVMMCCAMFRTDAGCVCDIRA